MDQSTTVKLSDVNAAISALNQLLTGHNVPPEPPDELAAISGYKELYRLLWETRNAIMATSSGDLTYAVKNKGYLAGAIKGLQASLRHLTWQTKAIADGDFSQRVDFMGDFSEAFNSMVVQLDATLKGFARAEAEIREAKEHFELIFSTSPDAAIISRLDDGHIINVNDAFTTLTGYSAAEAIGNSAVGLKLWSKKERQNFVNQLREKGVLNNLEVVFQKKDGSVLYGIMSAKVAILRGTPHSISITRDISDRKKLEEALQHQAHTDSLTGIHNRGYFMSLLEGEIERARRYGHSLSLIMLDIDHFKSINDSRGHAAGDEALRGIGRILKSSGLRQIDFYGRIGGEEFVIALPDTRLSGAVEAAERIRENIMHTPIQYNDQQFFMTASIGAAEFDRDDTQDTLLSKADHAMYRAKQDGRNRVYMYL